MGLFTLYVSIVLASCGLCLARQSYSPEDYGTACIGVVGSSYLWNRTECIGLTGKNLTTCQCGIPSFLETVVSCVDQLTESVEGESSESVGLAAYDSIIEICQPQEVQLAELEKFHSNSSQLEPYQGDTEIDDFGKCNATVAFRPTEWESSNALKAYKASTLVPVRSHEAGAAVLSYWGGVMLIRFVVHSISVLFPNSHKFTDSAIVRIVRRYVTVPATVSGLHSQSLYMTRHFPLNIPTREQTLIILGFLILHIGLTFGMLPLHRPSYLYKYNDQWLYSYNIAFRSGKMVVFEVPLLLLFAGRNNFLQWLTGWSHDTFVVFHKWIARSVAFSLLVHAIAHTVDKAIKGSYGSLWSVAFFQWGIAGAFFLGFLVFQAMYAIRRLSYEGFLIFHIILAIGFILAGYYHLKLQSGELQYFYAMWAVWAFDRTMRVIRVIISGPFSTAEVQLHDGNVLEYTIRYSKLWKPRPGDYAFIHIVQPSCFWQSHPFTISRGITEGEEDTLKLFTRAKNGITKRMMREAANNDGSFTTNIWIDGPYGPSYRVKDFEEAIFFSGGIGITAPFSYIQGILCDPRSRVSVIKLYWAIGDESPLKWFQNQIDFMRKSGRVEIHIHMGGSRRQPDPRIEQEDKERSSTSTPPITYTWTDRNSTELTEAAMKPSIWGHRSDDDSASLYSIIHKPLDTAQVVKETIKTSQGSLAVFSCAPDAINDAARSAVADSMCQATHYVEYFEEAFSW